VDSQVWTESRAYPVIRVFQEFQAYKDHPVRLVYTTLKWTKKDVRVLKVCKVPLVLKVLPDATVYPADPATWACVVRLVNPDLRANLEKWAVKAIH